jgi:hypothetical protein
VAHSPPRGVPSANAGEVGTQPDPNNRQGPWRHGEGKTLAQHESEASKTVPASASSFIPIL